MKKEEPGVLLPEWDMLPDIGLYMDQVVTLMERTFVPALPKGEMTKSMVNNYVKVGLVPRPAGKKYDREHLAVLLIICVLKQALSMENIARLLRGLCADGVKAGYAHFLTQLACIQHAAIEGRIEPGGEEETPQERALRAGIMASLCTIRASRLMDALEKETASFQA